MAGNLLPIHHISTAAQTALGLMEDRQRGLNLPLRTRWTKLNRVLLGGIDWNTNIVIPALSGSGKSAFVNILVKDLVNINTNEDFDILFFSFEMNSYQHIIRDLCNDLKQEYGTLISANEPLNQSILNKAKELTSDYDKYPIYFCQETGTVDQIYNTIMNFKKPEKKLIYIIDHTTLTNTGGESEFNMLTKLSSMAIYLKLKQLNITGIYLSQLNSEIESNERITKPNLHEPRRSDIFNAKAIYNMADSVLVIHRPETLGIEYYTVKNYPTKGKMFLHALKGRFGEGNLVIPFDVDFRYNIIKEENNEEYSGRLKF